MTTASRSHGPVLSGWLTFAGLLVLVIGLFNAIDGLVALFKDDFFLVAADKVLVFNYTAWGWIWLVIGIVQLAVGAGIIAGQLWARVVGIALAVIVAIGQLAFLQAFPWWSVLVIGMSILVIYALTVPSSRSEAA